MIHYQNRAVFDGHLRIYPTLRCNLHCSYCVNAQVQRHSHSCSEARPDQWIDAIVRENRHVVFTGGEPFLYEGLVQVINALPNDLKVRIYSNFCLDLSRQLAAITRPVHFFISWHPQKNAVRSLFMKNIRQMQEHPHCSAVIHAIDTPETRNSLPSDLAFFHETGLDVALDEDQRSFAGSMQSKLHRVHCSKTIYLIAPNGDRFQCVSRLVRSDRPMENIFARPLGEEETQGPCPDFGNCAPCDALGQTTMRRANAFMPEACL